MALRFCRVCQVSGRRLSIPSSSEDKAHPGDKDDTEEPSAKGHGMDCNSALNSTIGPSGMMSRIQPGGSKGQPKPFHVQAMQGPDQAAIRNQNISLPICCGKRYGTFRLSRIRIFTDRQ